MIVGRIILGTCYGNANIPVEILGIGPRRGTAWVRALKGLQPFTQFSHGGPCQGQTAVVLTPQLQDVHLEPEEPDTPSDEADEEATPEARVRAPDWFLESAYEDRTDIE